jgi:hypothetical protein
MEKQSLADNTGGKSECKKSRRPNFAIHSGNEYDITRLTELELEDLVVDLKNVDGPQFYSKWAHIYSGPVAEATAATVDVGCRLHLTKLFNGGLTQQQSKQKH